MDNLGKDVEERFGDGEFAQTNFERQVAQGAAQIVKRGIAVIPGAVQPNEADPQPFIFGGQEPKSPARNPAVPSGNASRTVQNPDFPPAQAH